MSDKRNIPAMRFKGFDGEWEETSIASATTVNSGRDYKHLESGNIPVYGTGGYMLSVNQALSYNKDAIGIGRKGTIDKPYILRAPFWTVDTLFFVIQESNYNLDYIYGIFQKTDWKKRDESTGVPSLSKVAINNIEFYSPENAEQQQIGRYFQNIDHLITQSTKRLEKLKNLKKAYLEKMFPRGGATTPELRFKGFSDEWECKALGMIGSPFTGLSGKTKIDFGHGEAVYITYMNVFSNPISNVKEVDRIEIDNKQNNVNFGDVLFTTSSETPEEVGMSSVWLGNEDNVYLNSFCFGYRPEIDIDPYYLAYLLRSSIVRQKISFLAQGISRYNISKNRVMEIEIAIPKIDEQTKIGNFFQNIDEQIAKQTEKLDKLKNIKKACLDKMFV